MADVLLPLASDPGFTWGDTWAFGLLFLAVALFAAIGALSHQGERAFSASLIYLGLGLGAALAVGLLEIRWIDPASLRLDGSTVHWTNAGEARSAPLRDPPAQRR